MSWLEAICKAVVLIGVVGTVVLALAWGMITFPYVVGTSMVTAIIIVVAMIIKED